MRRMGCWCVPNNGQAERWRAGQPFPRNARKWLPHGFAMATASRRCRGRKLCPRPARAADVRRKMSLISALDILMKSCRF